MGLDAEPPVWAGQDPQGGAAVLLRCGMQLVGHGVRRPLGFSTAFLEPHWKKPGKKKLNPLTVLRV